jgi:hypothetical protein
MKLSYANFAVGLLYGFGLGVILEHADLVNLTTFSLLLGGLILVPALGWVETWSHLRRMTAWRQIREKGMISFVALRYMLLRGGIFSLLLMFSLRGQLSSWSIHGITVPVVLIALGFIGVQEWNNCEQEYRFPDHARQRADIGDD